jgi:bacillithiol synthase
MNELSFSELPSQSKLFLDFINNEQTIKSRFEPTLVSRMADRTRVCECIRSSMDAINLTESQATALELYSQGVRPVVTGQQVGFIGGPLYSIYKIISAIKEAKKRGTVAIFWIEDNDHDAKESGTAYIVSKETGAVEVQAQETINTTERVPISERTFGNEIIAIKTQIQSIISGQANTDTVNNILDKILQVGLGWAESFILLIQELFGNEGLLMIRASQCRKQRLMAEMTSSEMESNGVLERCVLIANDTLSSNGYHIQAKPSSVNLFYHIENQRHKVHPHLNSQDGFQVGSVFFSRTELSRIAVSSPERFSPTVLLRPLIQDFILGTEVMIAGPGEIAYMAQLKEAYQEFNIAFPMIMARVSVTVVPKRIQRFLEKYKLNVGQFFRLWNEVERDMTNVLGGTEITESIQTTHNRIHELLGELAVEIKSIDATLEPSVFAVQKAVEKEIAGVNKKVQSALKRRSESAVLKYREAHSILYPSNELQERIVTPILLYNELGEQGVAEFIKTLIEQPSDNTHLLVDIPVQSVIIPTVNEEQIKQEIV